MRYLLFLPIIFLFTVTQAQESNSLSFGIKAGLSTTSIDANQLIITDQDDLDRLGLAIKDAKYGFHAGMVLRVQINKFLIQPEILFNSSQVDYSADDLSGSSAVSDIINEKYQYVDIPVLLGLKWGPLRLQAGPVGHVYLNSRSDFSKLSDIDYQEEFENMTIGWQGNLGLDVWNIMIDFRFENNFSNFGTHLNFAGQDYEFDDKPSRFLFSVGYLF